MAQTKLKILSAARWTHNRSLVVFFYLIHPHDSPGVSHKRGLATNLHQHGGSCPQWPGYQWRLGRTSCVLAPSLPWSLPVACSPSGEGTSCCEKHTPADPSLFPRNFEPATNEEKSDDIADKTRHITSLRVNRKGIVAIFLGSLPPFPRYWRDICHPCANLDGCWHCPGAAAGSLPKCTRRVPNSHR